MVTCCETYSEWYTRRPRSTRTRGGRELVSYSLFFCSRLRIAIPMQSEKEPQIDKKARSKKNPNESAYRERALCSQS